MDPTRTRGFSLITVLGTLVFVAGCPPEKPSERSATAETRRTQTNDERTSRDDEKTVVRVNGERMTLHQLEGMVERLPPYARARVRASLESKGNKQAYLTTLAQFQVMADVAERRGLGRAPEVVDALKATVAERAIRTAVRRRVSLDDITDEQVENYYREHADTYARPARRETFVFVTESRERAERIREELATETETVDERIEAFRKRASEGSVDFRTASRGGALGWLEEPKVEEEHPAIARVVFELDEAASLSNVFEVDGRWYIAIWRKERPASRQSLDEVASDIRTKLYERRRRRHREKLTKQWRREADVEVASELRKRLEAPPARRRTTAEDIPVHEPGAEGSGDQP